MKKSVLEKYIDKLKNGRTLLHVCCAPCSGDIIKKLLGYEIDFAVYFFNPNIYPFAEYQKRKDSLLKYIRKKNVTIIDDDYNYQQWLLKLKDYSNEPERGLRCSNCFYYRLLASAITARNNNFQMLATTLGISRYKNLKDVNAQGIKACANIPEVIFLDINWRKNGGSQKMYEVARDQDFYMQKYCGCEFSM